MKWIRQYEGPFLVIKVPSSVTAVIHRTAKARPKTVHIDKLKEFFGKPPKKWTVSDESSSGEYLLPSKEVPTSEVVSPVMEEVEVIRPLQKDKTKVRLSDERSENVSLVDEEFSPPEAVIRTEEVQLGLDEMQLVNSDEVLTEAVRQRLDEVQSVNSEGSEKEARLGLTKHSSRIFRMIMLWTNRHR